jgi:hypothetical protein
MNIILSFNMLMQHLVINYTRLRAFILLNTELTLIMLKRSINFLMIKDTIQREKQY